MVRIKHRYLLIDILYPPSSSSSSSKPASLQQHQHLQLHRPSPDWLTPGLLARIIRDCVGEVFGDYGMGKLGGAGAGVLQVKYLSPATSTAIIRCPRSSYRLVWAALTYLSSIREPKGNYYNTNPNPPSTTATATTPSTAQLEQRDCVFRVVRVSGTMKMAELEAIRRARREVVRLSGEGGGGEGKGMDVLEGIFGGGRVRVEDPERGGAEDGNGDEEMEDE